MIIFEQNGKEYQFRNEGSEVTLNELAKIMELMQDKKQLFFEKWLSVVEWLGSKELANIIDSDNLTKVIENFNVISIKGDIKEELVINNRIYKCNIVEGELKLTARQLAQIESSAKKTKDWVGLMFAIIYLDTDLSATEHNDKSHLEHKANLFKENIKADVAAPVIMQINKKLVESLDKMRVLNAEG